MAFTPKAVVFAARGGLVASVAGAIACVTAGEVLPPVGLAIGGFVTSLLALLAFPHVRRNELLVGVAAYGALTGYVMVLGWAADAFESAAAGLTGPAVVALTMSVVRIRNLAASNWHMSFVEWRTFDRRRPQGPPADTKAVSAHFAHHSSTS